MLAWDDYYDSWTPDRHRERVYHTKNFNTEEICVYHGSQETYDHLPIKKILIANIDQEITYKELKSTFSIYGEIVDCILKKKSGKKKSYAFITYDCDSEAQSALDAGYKKEIRLNNDWVRVIPAASWNQPDSIENQARKTKHLNEEESKDISIYNIIVTDENKDTIHVLNNDCLMHIFMYLPIADRVRIERVCKRWKAICEEFWRCNKKLDLKPITWGLSEQIKAHHVYKVLHKYGTYISNIDLSNNENTIGNATLISIAKLCPNVQTVNIKGLKHSSSGIKALADNCINIKKLIISLSDGQNFTNKGKYSNTPTANDTYIKEISRLFSKNRELQYLDLNCDRLNVIEFLLCLPVKSVKKLILRNISYFYISDVCTVLQKLQLQLLSINNIPPNSSIIDAIMPSAKNLKILQIPGYKCFNPSDERIQSLSFDLTRICEFNNLTVLNLKNNYYVDDDFLIKLSDKCKLLLKINIGFCHYMTNKGLKCVTTLPKLQVLLIDGIKNISDEVLTNIPELQTLSCTLCDNIHYAGLTTLITTSEKLKNLYVCFCKLITNDFLDAALEATKYRKNTVLTVFVYGTRITKFTESSFLKIYKYDELPMDECELFEHEEI
ncbi:uncharacterized protein LOC100679040 [Nasonia vitripennis]|uniref:RNA-binding protein EEED8.10 n=1 Tax=Nasonia vitripennis TaxID=7425 RepID=A0A7M7LVG2_NASVI|nr:uncharacterized protein LOC100679040 [Nasonia vitripennis]XP_016837401.1 uncharacterized protein LOC100679040 [Nasonia vitripennis]